MYEVRFSQKSTDRILSYIDLYKRCYEELYSDTGLGAMTEDVILSQYREIAENMKVGFRSSVEKLLENDTVFGYFYDPLLKIYAITASINNRRLFIEYREYSEEKIRVVMDVQILRK